MILSIVIEVLFPRGTHQLEQGTRRPIPASPFLILAVPISHDFCVFPNDEVVHLLELAEIAEISRTL
ncbi:hypothetical protein E1B28_000238 [Marasmius oreades]|uniref:Uncharacterized protein n=1 Tax=Marasmius oreades TaxID=181124 RepID=A0A9P8ADY0_9AGAR|nr:uncharacterized protein E1B28_000238 [Marasmius oreades]KAG7098276.1 hypothetical protein E1B28_000238 [Marasmius oreades]